MARQKTVQEIPFEQVSSSKVVPWIVGAMVYLIILTLGACAYIGSFITHFQKGLSSGFTVELTSLGQGFDQLKAGHAPMLERQRKALEVLNHYPGVKSAEPVGATYLEGLLSGWDERVKDPLFVKPTMINVEPMMGKKIDLKILQKYLHQSAPGSVVYASHPWKEHLMRTAWIALFMSAAFAGLICIIAMATIAFVTHSGLLIHERIIHILRLIGATNRYISKRFETYALSLAFRGSLWGGLLAGTTFWFVFGSPLHQPLSQTIGVWGVLIASPFLMALLTVGCARLSVSWALAKGTL